MNHQLIYIKIVEKAKEENRKKNKITYYEEHHILPKCMGGGEEKENKVLLTTKEHFVCHKLLTYIYPNNKKIIYAFCALMNCANIRSMEKFNVSARDYKYNRELFIKNISGENHPLFGSHVNKGKKRSVETRKKDRDAQLGKKYSKEVNKSKGRPLTQEHLNKMIIGRRLNRMYDSAIHPHITL